MSSSAIYLSSDDEKSSSRQSVPKLKGSENFIFWDLAIRTYLGAKCTESIERPRPVIDEHKLRQIQRDLSGTATYKKEIADQQKPGTLTKRKRSRLLSWPRRKTPQPN